MDLSNEEIAKKLGNNAVQINSQKSNGNEIIGGLKTANNGLNQVESIVDGINNLFNKIISISQSKQKQSPNQQVQETAPAPRIQEVIINKNTLENKLKDFIGMLPEEQRDKMSSDFEKNKNFVLGFVETTIKDVVAIR